MLIRQTPKNKEKYIIVDSKVSQILQENGFVLNIWIMKQYIM